jgi:hypothetical protein
MSKVSEGKVCRAVIDRYDVLAEQVFAVVSEVAGTKLTRDEMTTIRKNILAQTESSKNGLLTAISKEFAGQ